MAFLDGMEYLPKRNRSCFVYGCFSTAANKPLLGFHKFPRKGKRSVVVTKKNGDKCIYDRRQLWIEALNIGREASLAIDQVDAYVCSLHFARDDFYYNQDITGRRYLKEHAIPRRNLPARTTSPLTTKFNIRSLNRLKYRGYFSIHNPDGRKLTARRRFLGTSKSNEANAGQSYTKTVWVVRKPNVNKEPTEQENSKSKDGEVAADAGQPSTAAGDPQVENNAEEADDDEQCTILGTENVQEGSNPWFTSELIIKEEPMSDSEQVPDEITNNDGEEDDGDDDDDDDKDGYVTSKLVIETDEAEEVAQAEVEESQLSDKEQTHDNELTQPESEPTEEEEALDYENNEDVDSNFEEEPQQQDDDSRLDQEDDTTNDNEYGLAESLCQVCGLEDCEGHPDELSDENYFVCLVCSEIFPSQKQLAIHSMSHPDMTDEDTYMNEQHKKSLTCEFCGRVLSTKATLREHIMIHTGEKPHQCLLCGKSFRHKANLVVHVNGHAVVSTYKCKKCNKAFTKKMDFEKHLKFHVDASGNPLVCKICNAVFKSQRTLYNHAQLHSRKGMVRAKKRSDGPRDPVHVCMTCGKVLSTKATLKEHMMIHSGEKPHVCNICGRTIRHKANFVVHIQTHGQGKSYECDMCDEAFMRKSDLTQHKQVSHSKSKLLRCPICSEVFKSPQKFNRHMEIHESVVYMNETEELTGFEPHLLEGLGGFLE